MAEKTKPEPAPATPAVNWREFTCSVLGIAATSTDEEIFAVRKGREDYASRDARINSKVAESCGALTREMANAVLMAQDAEDARAAKAQSKK